MRSGVRDAIRTLLRGHADTPVLVLEDAHWADAATLRLVDDIAFDASLPVAVFAFARPDLPERLGDLWSRRNVLGVTLGPLTPRAALRLAHAALPDATDEVVEQVVALADGSPLVIEELVREFHQSGRLAPSLSAKAVFEAGILALPARERMVARAAAVIGKCSGMRRLAPRSRTPEPTSRRAWTCWSERRSSRRGVHRGIRAPGSTCSGMRWCATPRKPRSPKTYGDTSMNGSRSG